MRRADGSCWTSPCATHRGSARSARTWSWGPGQTTKELLRIPQGDAVGGSPLGVPIDARIPPAVSIDVDLSAVPLNHRVLFVGVTGSGADALTAPVTSNPATISALVQAWPHVAMRLVRVANRPA